MPSAFVASAQEPQTDRPVFRSGVSLVRLDVRVVDSDSNPIADLKQNEIEVTEGGVKRPLLLFQHVAGPGRSYVESAQRTIASDVSTNQGAPQGQLFILVFDQQHIKSGSEQPVRQAAEKFLRQRVRPQDRVAVYGLPGPGPALSFTRDVAAAREQLQLVRGGLERRASGAVREMTVTEAYEIVRGNEQVLARFTSRPASDVPVAVLGSPTIDRTGRFSEPQEVLRRLMLENARSIVALADADARNFLRSLSELLRGLRGIDGRKTLLLFSEGFYADNVGRELEDLAAACAQTYSVVHAFDLNRRLDLASRESSNTDDTGEIASRLEPLGSLAAETSGVLLKDASVRLESAFATLLPDDDSYYLLGFEPAPGRADTPYRRIKVNVTRAGARVITRTGYASRDAPVVANRRRAIDVALAAPFTQPGLKLEYTTYVGQGPVPGQQRVGVSLLAELPIQRAGAADEAADVIFVVRDARTGQVVASGSDRIPLPVSPEDGFSTGYSPWRVAFHLAAGDYIMRCVVREPGGIVGSADRRFTVRPLGGHDVAASDLVLVSPGESFPVRAKGYTGGSLFGTARVYARTADQLADVKARLDLVEAVVEDESRIEGRGVDATLGPVIEGGSGGVMRDVMFALPLEHLEAGPYVARTVIRANGEVVADLRRPVDVIVGAQAAAAPDVASRPREVLKSDIARHLIRSSGPPRDDAIARATAAADRGDWPAVLAALERANPEDPATHRLLGLARLDREDYSAAAAALATALDREPGNAPLAFVLGWARVGSGDSRGAIGAFRSAAFLEPTMVAAHLALAETCSGIGERLLAIQALEAGLRHLPQSPELRAMLASLRKSP